MNRALLIWRKTLNVVMLTLTGVAAFVRGLGALPDSRLSHLERRHVAQLELLHATCPSRWVKPAAAWPTRSSEA